MLKTIEKRGLDFISDGQKSRLGSFHLGKFIPFVVVCMGRRIELKQGKLVLEDKVEGFLERKITPVGNSAKADVPKRFIGQRVYVIIVKRD